MSDVGHLYHDASHGAILDVKEFLRTRKTNAREDKHLKAQTKVIDRAIDVTRRKHRHERASVKNDLKDILARTPSLATIRPFSSSAVALLRENEEHFNRSRRRRKGSFPGSASEVITAGAGGSVISATKSLPAIPTAYSSNDHRPKTVANMPRRTNSDLSFEFSNFSIKTSTLYKIRRVNNISKSLSALYAKMSSEEDRYKKMHQAHANLLDRFKRAEDNEAYQIAKIVLKNSKYRSLVDQSYDPQDSANEIGGEELGKHSSDLNTGDALLNDQEEESDTAGKSIGPVKGRFIKPRSSSLDSGENNTPNALNKSERPSGGFLKKLVEDLESDLPRNSRNRSPEDSVESFIKEQAQESMESGVAKLPEIWRRDLKPEIPREKQKVAHRVTVGGRIRKNKFPS